MNYYEGIYENNTNDYSKRKSRSSSKKSSSRNS
jgi:hypothetical protein